MGKREGLSLKQMGVIIKENTLLGQELTQIILDLYSQFCQNS